MPSWARERDRSRQAVLEGIGWKFHRIWSTDWFYNRDVELQKLLESIDRARTVSTQVVNPQSKPRRKIERIEVLEGFEDESRARAFYEEAKFSPAQLKDVPLAEMSERNMRKNVFQIIELEGPIHVTEVAKRWTKLCGFGRAGNRIQDRVRRTVLSAINDEQLRWDEHGEDSFVVLAKAPHHSTVRDRRHVDYSLRKPDMLPPSEIRQTVLIALKENIALEAREVATEVARQFGIASTSQALREVVERQVELLVGDGENAEVNGQFRVARRG